MDLLQEVKDEDPAEGEVEVADMVDTPKTTKRGGQETIDESKQGTIRFSN